MPFGSQFGQAAGELAGGAAGAAGGGLLSSLLAPLDYPRQALYNLVRSGGRALSGEGDWSDVASAAPGALGALLAGGLVASGVGAPLGILAGSALAGLGQGAGKATGREEFEAATPEDVAKNLGIDTESTGGKIASMGLGMLTDPLTYAGGLAGAARGGRLGEAAGSSLERALAGGAASDAAAGLTSQTLGRGAERLAAEQPYINSVRKAMFDRELATASGNASPFLADRPLAPGTSSAMYDFYRGQPAQAASLRELDPTTRSLYGYLQDPLGSTASMFQDKLDALQTAFNPPAVRAVSMRNYDPVTGLLYRGIERTPQPASDPFASLLATRPDLARALAGA